MSWAAADMIVRAIRAAGGAPDPRRGARRASQRMTEYTATASSRPATPPARTIGNCFVVITVEGGEWRRVEPASGSSIAERRCSRDWPRSCSSARRVAAPSREPLRPLAGDRRRVLFVVSAFVRADDADRVPAVHDPRHRRRLRSTPSPPPAWSSPTPRPASSTSPTARSGWSSAFVYWQLTRGDRACPAPLAVAHRARRARARSSASCSS